MNVLIVYATNSSGTLTASEIVERVLAAAGFSVMRKSADTISPAEIGEYDAVVFGSCTWNVTIKDRVAEGQLQQHFRKLETNMKGMSFPNVKFAVFGLGDSSYTNFCAAADHLVGLVSRLQGIKVGETLKLDEFYFHLAENSKRVEEWTKSIAKEFQKQTVAQSAVA